MHIGAGKVGQTPAVVDIQMGHDDVPHVGRLVAQSGYLPDGCLLLVERRLRHRHPVRTEGAVRIPDVAEAEAGFDQHEAAWVSVSINRQWFTAAAGFGPS